MVCCCAANNLPNIFANRSSVSGYFYGKIYILERFSFFICSELSIYREIDLLNIELFTYLRLFESSPYKDLSFFKSDSFLTNLRGIYFYLSSLRINLSYLLLLFDNFYPFILCLLNNETYFNAFLLDPYLSF